MCKKKRLPLHGSKAVRDPGKYYKVLFAAPEGGIAHLRITKGDFAVFYFPGHLAFSASSPPFLTMEEVFSASF